MTAWPQLNFNLRSLFTQWGAPKPNGRSAIATPNEPFLKTPWVYSGPESLDVSRLFGTPLTTGGYVLTQVVMKHHGPMLGRTIETDIDGPLSLIETMNQMRKFMQGRDSIPGIFALPTGRTNFETYARRQALAYDPQYGFIERGLAEAKAAQRAAAHTPAAV